MINVPTSCDFCHNGIAHTAMSTTSHASATISQELDTDFNQALQALYTSPPPRNFLTALKDLIFKHYKGGFDIRRQLWRR